MIINRISMEAVFNNFRADYEAGLLSAKPLKERIAMTTTSSTREETYAWLGKRSASGVGPTRSVLRYRTVAASSRSSASTVWA